MPILKCFRWPSWCRCLQFSFFGKRSSKSEYRTVYTTTFLKINDDNSDETRHMDLFCSNALVSSRYTWYNFIPKNTFEQLHNMANIFFSILCILFTFADGATSVWATLGPLIAIISVTMVKDGVDDIFRHRRDSKINSTEYFVLQNNTTIHKPKWVLKKAKSLCVGDVIYCVKDHAFPSDIVLLSSSNPNTEVDVTTVNLDGETNIKKYFAVTRTQNAYFNIAKNRDLASSEETDTGIAESLFAKIVCQQPTVDLTSFEGRISQIDNPQSEVPLNTWNLALRGAKLKNTEFVIGLIVYTGTETKLSLNSTNSVRKYSSRESRSNIILLGFILTMALLSVLFAVGYTVWTQQYGPGMWYIPPDRTSAWAFIQNALRFAFMFCYLIPISIIITLELQQVMIAFFISNDICMYSEEENECSKANTSQLADELGQVEFLFSDKTGTLTQNVMSLQKVAILSSDQVYNWDTKPYRPEGDDFSSSSSEDLDSEDVNDIITNANSLNNTTRRSPPSVERRCEVEPSESKFREWLTVAALCHTVTCTNSTSFKETVWPLGEPTYKVRYQFV